MEADGDRKLWPFKTGDKMDEKKRKALMLVIRLIVSKMGIIRDNDPAFKLFELAKRINQAENEHALQVVIEEVQDFRKLPH